MGPRDLEVAVSFSGISTGTERLLWEGTMPPFPGLSYPLVPGYETVGTIEKIEKKKANADRHPLKQIGSPENLAESAYFLLEKATWMTGQILHVDGGVSSLKV